MRAVSTPDVQALLPPIFACLPTAFVSPRPPPALLPLLSPILRQRVHLLLASQSSESRQNWLTLLTWRQEYAQRLVTVVSELQLEPHPVSGELELFNDDPDAGKLEYKRLDDESLQARCEVRQHGLAVIWTWCTNDSGTTGFDALLNGQAGNEQKTEDGWRVAQVLPVEDEDGNPVAANGWFDSIREAEAAFAESTTQASDGLLAEPSGTLGKSPSPGLSPGLGDEDDYWARYDTSPGPPAGKPWPESQKTNGDYFDEESQKPSEAVSELDYYAQYSSVQPAMDAHDPDEEESARDANSTLQPATTLPDFSSNAVYEQTVHAPSPKRSSAGSSVAEQLESTLLDDSPATAGIKQHISYELKSLFRLARRTGIEKTEFERIVRLELETLDVLEL